MFEYLFCVFKKSPRPERFPPALFHKTKIASNNHYDSKKSPGAGKISCRAFDKTIMC